MSIKSMVKTAKHLYLHVFRTTFTFKCKITKSNGEVLKINSAAIVNLKLHLMWNEMCIELNGRIESQTNSMFLCFAYIETFLNNSEHV